MLRKLYDEEDIEEEKIEKDEEEDSGPIYDTDGEGEFCERINFLVEEEFIEEIEEGTNFVIGDEIVEAIVEEINFVDMHKIVEEMIFTLWMPSNAYILHFEGLSDKKKYGERLDFTNYDLDSDVFVLSSLIDQKEKKDMHITFDKKFYAIRDVDFSLKTQKQQDQLFLDDGRILYAPKGDMMISKTRCVHSGSNQSRKKTLCDNSYANFLCCPQTKDILINSSFVVQKHQERRLEVCGERKTNDGPSSWECMEVVFHPQMEDTVRIEFGELFEEEHVYVEKTPSWNKEKVTLCNKNLVSRHAVREGSYGGTTQFGSY
ncbi:unnamed protein product [Lactuca saligna]|uniref:Uncharacterized protein n=1 Tax=Lactuca saligna TaxID=75948 RepID=A0AA35VNU9_LACSI|nr:unnamed protein product [Lactuca saligna]